MDFVLDFRLANHFTPGLDLTRDKDLVEGFLGNTLGDQICCHRVIDTDQWEDGIFCDGYPEDTLSGFLILDLA